MINYLSIGKGQEKVMFLHGWKMDHTCFDEMQAALDKNIFTYAFVDQRGYGLSKDQPGPYTIVQIAEDLIELADELNSLSHRRPFHGRKSPLPSIGGYSRKAQKCSRDNALSARENTLR